ncbi:hypothetical protein ACL02U_14670, partial [Streptomyces sp. MS06]
MGRNTRKRRSSMAAKAVAASAALALGGGGLIWANFHASAHESHHSGNNWTKSAAGQVATISCPDVGQHLTDVPNRAKTEVNGELATLDRQISTFYQRLRTTRDAQARDASFVRNAILGPLKDRRKAIIDRIQLEINRAGGDAPRSLDNLAGCAGAMADQGNQNGGGQDGGNQNGGG